MSFLLTDSQNPIPRMSVEVLFRSSITLWMMISSSSLVKFPLSDRWLHMECHFVSQFKNDKQNKWLLVESSSVRIVRYEQNLPCRTDLIFSWFSRYWSCWLWYIVQLVPFAWPFWNHLVLAPSAYETINHHHHHLIVIHSTTMYIILIITSCNIHSSLLQPSILGLNFRFHRTIQLIKSITIIKSKET